MKNFIYRTAVLLFTLSICASVFAQSMAFQGRVVEVIDGTTVTVLTRSNTEFRVRCRSTNAPYSSEAFALQSKQRLADLVLGQAVIVEYNPRPDGSIVGLILLNQRDVCLDQVKAGLATYDKERASEQSTYDRRVFAEAEAMARYKRRGIWERDSSTNGVRSDGLNTASDSAGSTASSSSIVNVRGYFRKDGTYVAPHHRTAPDDNFNNNWSTQGNVNPFTGEVGTKKPSRWKTALKWVAVGATIGALIYLDARYSTIPVGATALCIDGTYSFSQNRRGTCSWHGGVRRWLY